jgi:DNA-binding beta-propeller fold protein YncE
MSKRMHIAALALALMTAATVGLAQAKTQRQLWIANAYGDDVHVYEVGTWKLIRRIVVGSDPHGISATADGKTVNIALEAPKGEMLWIDTGTGKITHRMDLPGKPNEHDATPDGKWLYVPNRGGGHWWVVDGHARKIVTTIKTGGGPHNTLISADAKRMYLSAQQINEVTVVDIEAGHKVIAKLPFSDSLRPSALSSDQKRFFQNINNLVGFEVVDIPSKKLIRRVQHGASFAFPLWPTDEEQRSHGIDVRPDQKELWSSYVRGGRIYIHEMTSGEYREIGQIQMPGHVYWIRFNPDSKYAYVSLPNVSKVAVVDTATRKIVTLLAAGDSPKRTQVVDVPL